MKNIKKSKSYESGEAIEYADTVTVSRKMME